MRRSLYMGFSADLLMRIRSITFQRSLKLRTDSSAPKSQEYERKVGAVCGPGMRLRPGRTPSSVCLWDGLGLKKKTCNLVTTCNALGASQAHRLMIDSPHPGLPMSSWWELLGNLPGIEELELYSACVDTLSAAWKVNLAPAVLPALRKIRIEDISLASPQQYSMLGDPPARKIVQLPSHAEDDVAYLEPAEKELEDISKGLLKLLRGLGRKLPLNKR